MQNDTQPPATVEHTPVAQQPVVTPPAQPQTTPQEGKPGLSISDNVAIDLLTINNLQTTSRSAGKFPTKLIIIIATLVLLAAAASMAPGLLKSKGSNTANQTNTSAQKQSHTSTSDTSKQIDQDVQSCTDPVNAVTSC